MNKNLAEAMYIADQPLRFSQFHRYQEFDLFICQVNDFFLSLQIRARQQQTAVNAQLEGT